jgi:hypothetical protein
MPVAASLENRLRQFDAIGVARIAKCDETSLIETGRHAFICQMPASSLIVSSFTSIRPFDNL